MKLYIILAAVVLLGLATTLFFHKSENMNDKFQSWKAKYNKSYANDSETYRLAVFSENLKRIEAHNSKNSSYKMGENQFMDLTSEEFKAQYLGLIPNKTNGNKHIRLGDDPDKIDWTDKGCVTPVKDQGQCGSCWAFSTTGNLEATNVLQAKGKLTAYSEQQLVDCSSSEGNMGCNGGLMDYAFEWVISNGITTEDKYPYEAVDQKCKMDSGEFKISSYTDVESGDCDSLTDAIVNSPISVGVDALNWQFYSGGVFDDCGDQLDHGVLAVGYDKSDSTPYYKIKNSWAESWGEKGFIRLAYGNTCGVCNTASYSTY